MAEWTSVLAVFWVLWALDGVRLAPRALFTWIGGLRRDRARRHFGRWSWPGFWPTSWRGTVTDVPLAFSPSGICNRPAGSMGRPIDGPSRVQAWTWEEVREVGVARGWIFINGSRFCADTRHVSARQLLALARSSRDERERRIRTFMQLWFRPRHLQRRARILTARTRYVALLNGISLALLVGLSIYVIGDGAAYLPARWSEALVRALPLLLLGLLALHLGAIVLAWRAVRRLKVSGNDRRRSTLMSALLLPPQALRLRMVTGDGFFPVQHPLAAALAWAGPKIQAEAAFQVLADLKWPVGESDDPPLAREVSGWFRTALAADLLPLLARAKLTPDGLFEPPAQNSPTSCHYCPRCRDQFTAGPTRCPHGVPLQPLRRSR